MNCLHCSKYMYSFFESELSPQTRLEIERHLSECPACRFQYDLTITENQVLSDTRDIPELSPDFNQRVMNAIMPEKALQLPNDVIVMSKDRRYRFKRSYLLVMSAVAVVLLALCIKLPDILSTNPQKVAQTNGTTNVHLQEKQFKVSEDAATGKTEKYQAQICDTGSSSYGVSSESKISALNDNLQLAGASRMTNCEAGRSDRIAAQSEELSISFLAVKNIPDKYQLVSQNNSLENTADYSYQTEDGSQTINLQLNGPVPKAALLSTAAPKEAAAPIASMAPPAADEIIYENVSREIQIDGQTINIVLSGNVSIDELNSFADKIELSKTP